MSEKKTEKKSVLERQKNMRKVGYNMKQVKDDKYNEMIKATKKTIEYLPLDKLYPAPPEINDFPPSTESEMLELMQSIMYNGMQYPVIVWEQDDGYMIISGHNRTRAFQRLIEEVDESEKSKYETIMSIVYQKDELNTDSAKEKAIDTNLVQRKLTKRQEAAILKEKMQLVKGRTDKKGRTVDIVAKELGLSRTKVYEDYSIANNIIEEISDLYYDAELSKKAILRFLWFNKGVQKQLFEAYKDNINDQNCFKMKKTMGIQELRNCFKTDGDGDKTVQVVFRIKESLREDFREMALEWIKENH